MGVGEGNNPVFAQHSPAHQNKSHMSLSTWNQAKLRVSLIRQGPSLDPVHHCIQSAVTGQQREFILCSETRESSGAHAQEIKAETISFENVIGSQT